MFTKGKWEAEVSVSDKNGWHSPSQRIEITADDGATLIALYETTYTEYPSDEANAANAARIVQCVNSHDELVAALEPFAALLKECNERKSDDHPIYGIDDSYITAGDIRRAAKTLAKAKEVTK